MRLTIRPGGFDDAAQGWTGGYATRGSTSAVYLNGEFTVTEGQYARRKIFTLIGLYSPKGPDWANMGRSLVRGMLNSARGISDKDQSPQAQSARRINGLKDLDGIEFLARIDVGTDASGDDKNEIRSAVSPDHRDYAQFMGLAPSFAGQPAAAVQQPAAAPQPSSNLPRHRSRRQACPAVRPGRSEGLIHAPSPPSKPVRGAQPRSALRSRQPSHHAPISRPLWASMIASHGRVVSRRILKARARRRLNPLFVGWLMGWPIGHALCACSETEFSHWQQRMRGALSQLPMASAPWIWRPAEEPEGPAQMSLFEGMLP